MLEATGLQNVPQPQSVDLSFFLSRIIMRITSGIADMIVCSNEDDDDQSSVIVVMREALQFPELMS